MKCPLNDPDRRLQVLPDDLKCLSGCDFETSTSVLASNPVYREPLYREVHTLAGSRTRITNAFAASTP